jgi:hypothetical protein
VNFYDSEDQREEETAGKSAKPEPARPGMGYRENPTKCDDSSKEAALETQHIECLKSDRYGRY